MQEFVSLKEKYIDKLQATSVTLKIDRRVQSPRILAAKSADIAGPKFK